MKKKAKKLKIGLVTFHSFAHPGGVKRHVLGLYDEFKKRGFNVKVIIPRRSQSEKYGKDVILLGTSIPLSLGGTQTDLGFNFNPFAINKVLKKEGFDVLHFHNFTYPSAFQVLARSNSLNILTFHANLEKTNFFKVFPFLLAVFTGAANDAMDGIIGVNELNLKPFARYPGPKTVIPNGIDLDEFKGDIPKIEKYRDGKINILFLGRIEPRKGLIYLLKAYEILDRKYNNLRLIIVGDGPSKQKYKDFVKKYKISNVVFEKQAKEKDVASYYKTADIFCSPAIYGESFGIVLVEAMASGIPVVAFANSGYKVVMENGKGWNFLVRPKDIRGLASKLEILAMDKGLRKEMGEWGMKEAKKYAWPKIADQVLDFYALCKKKTTREIKSKRLNFLDI